MSTSPEDYKDKFKLMEEITSSFPSTYAAAHWLRKPNPNLGRTPAEAINDASLEDVWAALYSEKKR